MELDEELYVEIEMLDVELGLELDGELDLEFDAALERANIEFNLELDGA